MRLMRKITLLASIGMLAVAVATPVAAAPTSCAGAGIVFPVSTPEIHVADGTTFVEFDFAGEHPVCLADGARVQATVSGHLWEKIHADGSGSLRFIETLSWGGGELDYSGNATFNASAWKGHVRTVGNGTGPLTGINGQGTFSPIDPLTGTFTDEIFYVYR